MVNASTKWNERIRHHFLLDIKKLLYRSPLLSLAQKKSPLLKISWCTNSNILYFEFATCAHLPITRPPTIIPLLNCWPQRGLLRPYIHRYILTYYFHWRWFIPPPNRSYMWNDCLLKIKGPIFSWLVKKDCKSNFCIKNCLCIKNLSNSGMLNKYYIAYVVVIFNLKVIQLNNDVLCLVISYTKEVR